MERFLRTELLIGKNALKRLASSTVVVAGLGAVGSYAVEALARAGVGRLRLVDMDTIKKSNINRQIHALETTVGRSKSIITKERVLDINPGCSVEALDVFVHSDTMDMVLKPPVDFVVDALDSLNPKVELLTSAFKNNLSVVSSMGAALRTDISLIKTGDIFDTHSCPLAKQIRKRLRNRGVGRGIDCVFSTEKINFEYREPEENNPEGPEYERGRKRRTLGSLPTIPGIYGLMLSNMVIMKLVSDEKYVGVRQFKVEKSKNL